MKLSDAHIQYIQDNPALFTIQRSDKYPTLSILNCSDRVEEGGIWNTFTIHTQGLVVDHNWNIVSRPFPKLFDQFEKPPSISNNESVTAVRKVDGFLATATWVPSYGMVVATKDSLDSKQVEAAKKYLTPDKLSALSKYAKSHTFIFEIVDSIISNLIIEEVGAHLIGYREIWSEDPYTKHPMNKKILEFIAQDLEFLMPEVRQTIYGTLVKSLSNDVAEGWIVYGEEENAILDTPYYRALKGYTVLPKR